MLDILGAVNDFILAYCSARMPRNFLGIPDVLTCPDILYERVLEQSQVVRGWQNVVSALPKGTQTYAVLTLLGQVRHGTNVHGYVDLGDGVPRDFLTIPDVPTCPDILRYHVGRTREVMGRLAENLVQVDFCCAYPQHGEEVARDMADTLEMLTRDSLAVDFFAAYGITACYADDPRPLPSMNEAEQWEARYSVTMHLTAWTKFERQLDAFSRVGVYIENVDHHHPVVEK